VFDVVSDDGPHLPMQEWIAARCPRLQDRPTTGLPALLLPSGGSEEARK